MFTNKKRAGINIHLFVVFPSMSLKRLKPQSRTMNPPLPIIPFGIVVYGFVFLETAVFTYVTRAAVVYLF